MGTDVTFYAERKVRGKYQIIADEVFLKEDGEHGYWVKCNTPFSIRNYRLYAFLCSIRNYYSIESISTPTGLPKDVSPEVKELLQYEGVKGWFDLEALGKADYQQQIRVVDEIVPVMTCLGVNFWYDYVQLLRLGASRLVYGADC